MAEIITQVTLFFESIILTFGYPGIFLVLLAENVITPIPTEPFMPLAGILAAQGQMNFFLVWGAAIAGGTTGSTILYFVGRHLGEPTVRALVRRWGRYTGITEGALDKGIEMFNRYGGWVIFFARFLPVVRPTSALVAGMSKLKLSIFLPATAASASIVTFLYIFAGYILGENWRSIVTLIDQYEPIILAVAIIGAVTVVGYILLRWLRHRAASAARALQPEES